MKYTGSCHCGQVAIEVEGDLKQVMACNCSMCARKGSLLWFVPREQMRVLSPEADISTYTFNKHLIKHRFCPDCGMHPFAEAVDPSTGKPTAAINVRCLEDVDLSSIPVKNFNGRAL